MKKPRFNHPASTASASAQRQIIGLLWVVNNLKLLALSKVPTLVLKTYLSRIKSDSLKLNTLLSNSERKADKKHH